MYKSTQTYFIFSYPLGFLAKSLNYGDKTGWGHAEEWPVPLSDHHFPSQKVLQCSVVVIPVSGTRKRC